MYRNFFKLLASFGLVSERSCGIYVTIEVSSKISRESYEYLILAIDFKNILATEVESMKTDLFGWQYKRGNIYS